VALNEPIRINTSVAFDIVNVLCVIGEQFAFVLQQADESMSRRCLANVRKRLTSKGVEDACSMSVQWSN